MFLLVVVPTDFQIHFKTISKLSQSSFYVDHYSDISLLYTTLKPISNLKIKSNESWQRESFESERAPVIALGVDRYTMTGALSLTIGTIFIFNFSNGYTSAFSKTFFTIMSSITNSGQLYVTNVNMIEFILMIFFYLAWCLHRFQLDFGLGSTVDPFFILS